MMEGTMRVCDEGGGKGGDIETGRSEVRVWMEDGWGGEEKK